MRKHSLESALFLHREVYSCLINALSGHALTGIKVDFCQVLTPCTTFALVGGVTVCIHTCALTTSEAECYT